MRKSTRQSGLRFWEMTPMKTTMKKKKTLTKKRVCVLASLRVFSLISYTEVVPDKECISDRTETNLVNLRKVIYLTIMNALNYEEAVHKLQKIQIEEGQEV